MFKFWGRTSSINVRKVLWAVQRLGTAFERTDAGAAFGIVKTPDYLAKNPNALVPLIEDEGFALWESNVILRYLCAKYGAPRSPLRVLRWARATSVCAAVQWSEPIPGLRYARSEA